MMVCSECAKEMSDQAKACPHCGAAKPGSWFWLKLLLAVGSCLFLLAMAIGFSSKDDGRGHDRDAIKLCWKEQSRKSLDPGTSRFIASTCEMMEQNFKLKYNASP